MLTYAARIILDDAVTHAKRIEGANNEESKIIERVINDLETLQMLDDNRRI